MPSHCIDFTEKEAMTLKLLLVAVVLVALPGGRFAFAASDAQNVLLDSAQTKEDRHLVEKETVPGAPLKTDGLQEFVVTSQKKHVAILRSLVAGLSTSLGAAVVLLTRGGPSPAQMAFALALAAGVMLTVSLVELFIPPLLLGEMRVQALASGFAGFLSFLILRHFVPEPDMAASKKHEDLAADAESGSVDQNSKQEHKGRQWRLAMLMMAALTAHNFPEGLAVGVSSLSGERLGLVVMAAIAIHNIPEGIAIAMPVLDATGSRWRAMQMATLSGLAEPLGAWVAVTLLPPGALSDFGMNILLCVVGGIMTSVACAELLPEALAQQRPVSTLLGLLTGAAVMLLTHELA